MPTIKYLNGVPVPQAYSDTIADYEGLKSVNGAMRVAAYDTSGNPLLTVGNPGNVNITNEVEVKNDTGNPLNVAGTVNIGTMPEFEIKNDSGNPLAMKAADGDIISVGAKADAAVTDPTVTASVVAILKGLLKQAQNGTGKAPIIDQTETLNTAPATRIVTLTETPIALTAKSNLKQITIRNIDLVIRARIGETGMTPANGKGIALEPGAIYQEVFDPGTAVSIYGRSEGASVQVEVYEV